MITQTQPKKTPPKPPAAIGTELKDDDDNKALGRLISQILAAGNKLTRMLKDGGRG